MFDDFDLISAKEMRNRQEGLKDRDEIVKKIQEFAITYNVNIALCQFLY